MAGGVCVSYKERGGGYRYEALPNANTASVLISSFKVQNICKLKFKHKLPNMYYGSFSNNTQKFNTRFTKNNIITFTL